MNGFRDEHQVRWQGFRGVGTLLGAPLLLFGSAAAQDVAPAITRPVTVTVDTTKAGNFLAPRALGAAGSFYDGDLLSPDLPAMLKTAGILTLHYPAGRTTDEFHWSKINKYDSRKLVDFGSFVKLVDKLGGTMVLSVNYGSNLKNDGPGEPAEAAAWVAYTNGKPDDAKVIGNDSTGVDWKTVGYWATMRSSAPLNNDDGYNFLRISHPQGLNVKYWEVGNEVYTNGYYAKDNGGAETDRHGPYDADKTKNGALRGKDARLGPTAYGKNVALYSKAMKDVDGRISIGASLAATTGDQDWNTNVLKACAPDIDFVVLHWYTGNPAPPDYKNLDSVNFLGAPTAALPEVIAGLLDAVSHAGVKKNIQLAVTEIGYPSWMKVPDRTVLGVFAADAYASLAEDGAVNIDWGYLHGDDFIKPATNQPQAVFFGVQMLHKLLNMRDTFVVSKSSNELLTVHAAKRADGQVGMMFVNKDPANVATVKVKVTGDNLSGSGTRFDWGAKNPAAGNDVQQSKAEGLGNSFSITVPPSAVTDLVIPLAK